MRIALGVHVSTYEVVASLVDTGLPELGPVASRTVQVAAAPGGIAGAVSTALGFMRVQAMQNDLPVAGAAVVCENSLQRELVADALAETESEPVLVVDMFDARLADGFSPDIAAALVVGSVEPTTVTRIETSPERRGIWPVAAAAACVLAALGGVTAWAVTTETPPTTPGAVAPVEVDRPASGVVTTMVVPPAEPAALAPENSEATQVPTAEIVIVDPAGAYVPPLSVVPAPSSPANTPSPANTASPTNTASPPVTTIAPTTPRPTTKPPESTTAGASSSAAPTPTSSESSAAPSADDSDAVN